MVAVEVRRCSWLLVSLGGFVCFCLFFCRGRPGPGKGGEMGGGGDNGEGKLTVASSIKCGLSGSGSRSSGSWKGFFGMARCGVGIRIDRAERAAPRRGRVGMLLAWVRKVRVVL